MSTVTTSNKPYVHTVPDIYKAYAVGLLKENPEWWGKYEKRMKNYRVFRKEGVKVLEVISYPRFRKIIEEWFKGAQDYIIEGEALVMGNNLGRIAARRVERNFKNQTIDWKATQEMWAKKGERKGHVYHLSEDWIRIGWNKPGKIRNETYYRFTPAEGNNTSDEGFKKKFVRRNQEDKYLQSRYEFHPYIKETKEA